MLKASPQTRKETAYSRLTSLRSVPTPEVRGFDVLEGEHFPLIVFSLDMGAEDFKSSRKESDVTWNTSSPAVKTSPDRSLTKGQNVQSLVPTVDDSFL